MNSELKIWAISSAAAIGEAIAERQIRQKVFIQDPESIKEMLWEWFPGSVKTEGEVAKMSCKAPLFLADYQRIQKSLESLAGNDKIKLLVLEVNSPGGEVCGAKETYEALREFPKATVAVCCGSVTSAAYWLSSACGSILATESTTVGSVGVIATHISLSGALDSQGITVTEVCRGSRKNQFSPNKELDESAKKELDKQVGVAYKNFVDCVKESRQDVKEVVFESGVYSGADAISLGLIDKMENKLLTL